MSTTHRNLESVYSGIRRRYAGFFVAVALRVVVKGRLRSWHVPERDPVAMQTYPVQQVRAANVLHEPREDDMRHHLEQIE